MKIEVMYKDLKDGDKVSFYGYDWKVSNVTRTIRENDKCVYFTLTIVDRDSDLANTSYDGGQYGGVETLTIAKII